MTDTMSFPKTLDEFMEQYKIVDTEQVYTNGTELVPIFRIKQWEDAHQQKTATEKQKAYAKYLVRLRKLIDGEEKRCFPPDYIDRRKLTAEMMELIPTRLFTEEDMLDLVNEQPRADMVEVVRCKDCKFYSPNNGGKCTRCGGLQFLITEDEYCSKGEQK